jgi:hypothetical protein
MRRLILCGLVALTVSLGAGSARATTLYKWVDAQGVVHYSDTPQPGAQKIQVQSAQTYSAPKPARTTPTTPASSSKAGDSSAPGVYQCQLVSPTPEQAFVDPDAVSIAVAVTPALTGSDRLVVTMDGTSVPVSPSGQAQVPSPERGTHTISASVQGADGSTACSASVTFNVARSSLLSPQSPAHH